MKIRLTSLIVFTLLFQSCSTDSNNSKESIKKWLNTNLNDQESYEPLEYKVLDSSYLEYGNLEFSNYTTAIQRRADLSDMLEKNLNEKKINFNLDNFFNLNDSIITKTNSFWNFMEIKKINHKILKEFQNKNHEKYSSDQNYLNLISQIKGTNARIELDEEKVEESLKDMCLTGDYAKKIRDGLLVQHKFRAKNAFGAKIINERIFELNQNKNLVINSCKLNN